MVMFIDSTDTILKYLKWIYELKFLIKNLAKYKQFLYTWLVTSMISYYAPFTH